MRADRKVLLDEIRIIIREEIRNLIQPLMNQIVSISPPRQCTSLKFITTTVQEQNVPPDVRYLRGKLHLTLKQFAQLLEVTPQTVKTWESGKYLPTSKNLEKVNSLLKMPYKQLAQLLRQKFGIPKPCLGNGLVQQIIALQRKLHLSQRQIANLIEVNPATISLWKMGRSNPSKAYAEKITTLLGMSPEEINRIIPGRKIDIEYENNISHRLRNFRQKVQISKRELAKLTNVTPATITYWEDGTTTPNARRKKDLAVLLGLSREQLAHELKDKLGIEWDSGKTK